MRQFYIIGDVHGRLDLLQSALREWDRKNEQLILMGDYVGYGPYSKQTLVELNYLQEQYGAIALRGNHDQFLLEFLLDPNPECFPKNTWASRGRPQLLKSFLGDDASTWSNAQIHQTFWDRYPKLASWIKAMPLFYETEQFIFVHAGIDFGMRDWRKDTTDNLLTRRSDFINGRNATTKTVIFGHSRTGVLRGMEAGQNKSDLIANPFLDDRVWVSPCGTKLGVDGGAVFGGLLHGLHVREDREEMAVTTVQQNGNRQKSLLLPKGGSQHESVS